MDKDSIELKRPRDPGEEIWVNSFDEESAQKFREELLDEAKSDSFRPIIVYIDSYGGQVDALSKMIETMDEVPNPVMTVAVGKVMSAGAILLSHGDLRFCGHHARIMVHEISSGTSGDVHDMNADAQETIRLNRYFMGLLAKNCGIKGGYDALRKMIKNRDGRDNYMDADAALKFGIVDIVGMPRVSRMKLYNVEVVPPKSTKKETKKSETKRSHQKRGGK